MQLLTRQSVYQLVAISAMGLWTYLHDGPSDIDVGGSGDAKMSYYVPRFPPPVGVSYENNPTVFGQILRSEIPTIILNETTDFLIFRDKKPRAPLHDLVIPKQRIGSVFDLQPSDLPIIETMKTLALAQIQLEQPEAYAKADYRLVFHVPPFNSVDHLHLHVLAPASKLSFFHGIVKYKADTRLCVSVDMVMKRLKEGRRAMPYDRPTAQLIAWKRHLFEPRKQP